MIYEDFSYDYDHLMGDLQECKDFILALLSSYDIQPQSVLEIGCGTGEILDIFPDTTRITGIDISPHMIKLAKIKHPTHNFICGDICNYQLPGKYDLICAFHDVLNHITDAEKWRDIFQKSKDALNPDGYFVFDINSLSRLQELWKTPLWENNFSKNKSLTLKVQEKPGNLFEWNIEVLEKGSKKTTLIYKQKVEQIGREYADICTELSETFEQIWLFDPENDDISPSSSRIYFLCR